MHQRNLALEFEGPQRVVEILARGADRFGEREMIVTPSGGLTYTEVDDHSRLLAKRLIAEGLGKGSRVAVHLPNSADWIVAFFAVTRIGALFMPFSAAYKSAELRRALVLGDVHLLLAGTESWHGGPYQAFLEEAIPDLVGVAPAPLAIPSVPHLRKVWLSGDGPAPTWSRRVRITELSDVPSVSDALLSAVEDQVVPADDAIVIWTSGTTADPKGAIHSQGTVARRAKANARSHAFVAEDRVFCDFAFWWVGGPGYGFLPTFWVGATLLAIPRRDQISEETLAALRPTRIAGNLGSANRRLLATRGGSSHMSTPPGIGMTETFGPHSMHEPASIEEFRSSPPIGLGPTILGFERRIVDPGTGTDTEDGEVGELLVRGPGMIGGLYRRERDEVFDAAGWYHTGDRCRIVDGSIHFVSRLNDMIKTSGSNVAPLEVEIALGSFPGVDEAAVFGIPDAQRGQQVVAVVVASAGATLDEKAIREHVRHQLSNFKVPRQVFVLEQGEVPRLHSGKIDRRAVAQVVTHLVDRADAQAG